MLRRRSSRSPRPSARSRPPGFTLLELLVVLALFGLVTALLVGGSNALLRGAARDDAESVALGAVANVRNAAVLAGQTLELRYDDKARALDWGSGRAALNTEDEVRLLPPARVSAVLIGGRLQESALARVRFYADGTCDPFRLEIVRTAERTSRILNIDPWTCTALTPDRGAAR